MNIKNYDFTKEEERSLRRGLFSQARRGDAAAILELRSLYDACIWPHSAVLALNLYELSETRGVA